MKKLILFLVIFSQVVFCMESAEEDINAHSDSCAYGEDDDYDDDYNEYAYLASACSLTKAMVKSGYDAIEIAKEHPEFALYVCGIYAMKFISVAADCSSCFQCDCYCRRLAPKDIGVAQNMLECAQLCNFTQTQFNKCIPSTVTNPDCSSCFQCDCYCGRLAPKVVGIAQSLLQCAQFCNFTQTKFAKCLQ